MPGIGDLFGKNGVLEQLMLWGVVNQVIGALGQPAFITLTQDIQAKNPELALQPDILARAFVRDLITGKHARAEARKSGIVEGRFDTLAELERVRIPPAALAEAVLRSYLSLADAESEAKPQGITPRQLRILRDLAGDAPGPDELAVALRRGVIHEHGRGEGSTSFEQGIAETRLHNKWGPVVRELARVILSPPEAAEAAVRHFLSDDRARRAAERAGVSGEEFEILRHLAGAAPAPGELAVALRRGIIEHGGTGPQSTSFAQGIAEGRVADKWAPVIRKLAVQWPTPTDALQALLEGQVSEHKAHELYERFGGDPEFFEMLFHTRGSAPTPLEAADMARRGIIPWDGTGPEKTSYEQAFLEGPWRNKWAKPFRRQAEYLPPQSTVVTLLSHRAIDEKRAAELLAKQGMTRADIEAYIAEAHTEMLSEYRGLTVSTTLEGYYARLISKHDATVILESLHVNRDAAEILLAYADIRRAFAEVNRAVSRVRSLFAARKITVRTAHESLGRLGIPKHEIVPMIEAWEVENSISVKVLTSSQIAAAFKNEFITQDEAMTELGNIGYTPFDSWVLLSNEVKTALPGKPRPGVPPPQAQVVPGTT
jgi:predicted nucleic acid-binding protein